MVMNGGIESICDLRHMTRLEQVDTDAVPPPIRRGPEVTSGTPSGMMA